MRISRTAVSAEAVLKPVSQFVGNCGPLVHAESLVSLVENDQVAFWDVMAWVSSVATYQEAYKNYLWDFWIKFGQH